MRGIPQRIGAPLGPAVAFHGAAAVPISPEGDTMRRCGLPRLFAGARARAFALPRVPGGVVRAICLTLIAMTAPAAAEAAAPGGFVEPVTSTAVRSPNRPSLPDRGPFTFPAPYNTTGVRITNAGDCQGQDCLNYVGYSYWRNTNNHAGRDTMLIVLSLNRTRGGGGPTLFSYDKNTDAVTNMGPLFDPASGFSWATGEGWYFSATQ